MSIIPENTAIPQTKAMSPIQATMPTPGGPQGKPISVRDTLMQELSQAGQLAEQTDKRLGVQRETPRGTIRERGILIGGKQVAMAELKDNMFNQDRAIEDYLRQSGYTDTQDYAIAKSYMNDRLNSVRTQLLKMANDFNKQLMKEKVDAEKKGMFAKNLGSIAGAITGAMIAGAASGGNPFAIVAAAKVGSEVGKGGAGAISQATGIG